MARAQEHGVIVQEVRLQESGVLDLEDMAAKISRRTKVFALGASSNALAPSMILRSRAASRATRGAAGDRCRALRTAFSRGRGTLDPDFLLCSAYKFYGPHVGILYSRPGTLERLPTSRLSVQDPPRPIASRPAP